MITLDLSILNQKGTPMFFSDLTANRPSAGIVGRIFIATDSPYGIFRDTGTAWDQIAGSGGGGGISGSGAATQVAFWNGTSSISGSNNLWWDSTNNYFGINTNTPGNPLDVHGNLASIVALNQTTSTNNTLLSLLNSGSPLWRIGNYYSSGANDFAIFDVVGALQQLTIVKTTGQTFIGSKTTASGRLVINSATADAHLQIVGANSPSIRIDNAGSGGTQRFAIGNVTATNNFIQGSAAGQFCITTASSGAMLFGMWQTTNATEVMRISTASNLLIYGTTDTGEKVQITGTAKVSGALYTGTTSNVGIFMQNNTAIRGTATTGGNIYIDANAAIDNTGTINLRGVVVAQSTIFAPLLSGTNITCSGGVIRSENASIAGLRLSNTTSSQIWYFENHRNAPSGSLEITKDISTPCITAFNSNSVSIGSFTETTSAQLSVTSTTKGFLPPRMTTTQKNAISSPAAGLIVYDSTLNKLCVYTTAWETITSI